jgi:hypothetical protein
MSLSGIWQTMPPIRVVASCHAADRQFGGAREVSFLIRYIPYLFTLSSGNRGTARLSRVCGNRYVNVSEDSLVEAWPVLALNATNETRPTLCVSHHFASLPIRILTGL